MALSLVKTVAAMAVVVMSISCATSNTEVSPPPAEPRPTKIPWPGGTAAATSAEPQPAAAPPVQPGYADGHAVDPSTLISDARIRAPAGSKLSRLAVHYVASNGRVDLGASTHKAWIHYRFRRPPIPAEQTPGAPVGVVTPAKHFPDTIVSYEGSSVTAVADEVGDLGWPAESDPVCSLAQVWAAAIAAGAPPSAVADVTFPADTANGKRVWNFSIQGTNGVLFHAFVDDITCTVKKQEPLL